MKLCNETITVFNTRLDEESGMDTYHSTIISGVSWYSDIAASIEGGGGLKAANKFIIRILLGHIDGHSRIEFAVEHLRIPVNADFSGKAYADPIAYAGGDPKNLFTLKNGDIIVRGAVDGTGLRPADLKKMYPEIVTILGVTDSTKAPNAQHWKVVGA